MSESELDEGRATEVDEAGVDEGRAKIRLERTRSFLVTHLALSGIGILAVALEFAFGLGQNQLRLMISAGVMGSAVTVTLIGFLFLHLRKGISVLIPTILFVDSIIIMLQIYQEGDMETAWVTAPVLLIIMLPLFSDRPRFVWVLATFQIVAFYGLLELRASEIWPYQLRTDDFIHDMDFGIFTWIGFIVMVVGSALLAGRTSVDVLNSNRQLDEALKRQEKALARANARIVQQQKLLSVEQLTAGIMHEINNPLTFVRTNLGSLSRDLTDVMQLLELYGRFDDRIRRDDPDLADEIEDARDDLCLEDDEDVLSELLADACDGVDRVQNIIHDLRVFSRLDEAERKPIQLREGIDSTLKIIRRQFDEKQIELEVKYDELPEIEVFPALFNQVVMNLVQNAFDAVGPKGRVRVSTAVHEDGQQVIVEDTGSGVPDDIVNQIFDPFFTTKTVGEGTGLGLSLSMDIVTKHGGRLDVGRSPELGGARFVFEIPRVREAA